MGESAPRHRRPAEGGGSPIEESGATDYRAEMRDGPWDRQMHPSAAERYGGILRIPLPRPRDFVQGHAHVPGTYTLFHPTNHILPYRSCINENFVRQTREYKFTLSNPGVVNTVFAWKITTDEQYPKRLMENDRNVTSTPRSPENAAASRTNSRSSRGIFSAPRKIRTTSTLSRNNFDRDEQAAGDSANLYLRRSTSSPLGTEFRGVA